MREWCLIHWKSTVAVVIVGLIVLDNIVVAIASAIEARRRNG